MSSDERVIRKGEAYGLEEFKRRAGWSQHAYRAAKRKGLKVFTAGKRVYVTGDSFFEFLEHLSYLKSSTINPPQ